MGAGLSTSLYLLLLNICPVPCVGRAGSQQAVQAKCLMSQATFNPDFYKLFPPLGTIIRREVVVIWMKCSSVGGGGGGGAGEGGEGSEVKTACAGQYFALCRPACPSHTGDTGDLMSP